LLAFGDSGAAPSPFNKTKNSATTLSIDPRARASRSRCLLHRKRESQCHVIGCTTLTELRRPLWRSATSSFGTRAPRFYVINAERECGKHQRDRAVGRRSWRNCVALLSERTDSTEHALDACRGGRLARAFTRRSTWTTSASPGVDARLFGGH